LRPRKQYCTWITSEQQEQLSVKKNLSKKVNKVHELTSSIVEDFRVEKQGAPPLDFESLQL